MASARTEFNRQMRLMRDQQKREQAWSARQADKQMRFQERMANTQHQREVADLQAAGLNPALSAGGSGAASPAGSEPSYASSIVDAMPMLFEMMHEAQATARAAARGSKTPVVINNDLSPEMQRKVDEFTKKDAIVVGSKDSPLVHSRSSNTHHSTLQEEQRKFDSKTKDNTIKFIKDTPKRIREKLSNLYVSGRINMYGPNASASGRLGILFDVAEDLTLVSKAINGIAAEKVNKLGRSLKKNVIDFSRSNSAGVKRNILRQIEDEIQYARYIMK